MANTDGNEAPGDVELRIRETSAPLQSTSPIVLEQARLGNLDQFRTELERGNLPLAFKAGRAVCFNRTPLHLAAMEGHEEIVEFILNHPEISRRDANARKVVNAKDNFGYTPLHLAVRHSRENVVRLLTSSSLVLPDRFLAATSEPDDLDKHCGGYTPLHLAAVNGDIAIAELLLRQPCQEEFAYDPVNLHAVTWGGKTPLDTVWERYYPSFNEYMLFLSVEALNPFSVHRIVRLRSSYDTTRRRNYLELVSLLTFSDSNWLQQYRERTTMSANAILVGSALVVAATFGAWLQPPGGIPFPDQSGAPSSSPSAFGSADKYWNSVFYVCVAFAFSFSVVALVIGTMATLPIIERTSIDEVSRLGGAVGVAQICLLFAVLFLLFCFSFAGSIVLRNFAAIYGTKTYYTVIWLPVIAFVCVFYFFFLWGLNFHQYSGMKMRMMTVFSALVYGIPFIVTRVIRK